MFSYRSDSDGLYHPALLGNGEICMLVGEYGRQSKTGADGENQLIFWAGLRVPDTGHSLLPLGRFAHSLACGQVSDSTGPWEQRLDPRHGVLTTAVHHACVRETSETQVSLEGNFILIRYTIENTAGRDVDIGFAFRYDLEDGAGQVPARCQVTVAAQEPYHVYFVPDGPPWNPGEVIVQARGFSAVRPTANGVRCRDRRTLRAGEAAEFHVILTFEARDRYQIPPRLDEFETYATRSREAWQRFHAASGVSVPEREIVDFRTISLYLIRACTTPWSIPTAILGSHWSGRYFHDEFYPFSALLTSNHADLAERIPRWRLSILPAARTRARGRGARYAWESLEDGAEGTPFGQWLDEIFHMGQFAEEAWNLYQYTLDARLLEDLYPLWKACAEYYVYQGIEEIDAERARARACTDFDESAYPVSNPLFTGAAIVRTLEVAAAAAQLLGRDEDLVCLWRGLAERIRRTLPVDPRRNVYLTREGADYVHAGVMGTVYPFRIDVTSARARAAVEEFRTKCRADLNYTPKSTPDFQGMNWTWKAALLAAGLALQGEGDKAVEVLRGALRSAGTFMAPNEYRQGDRIYHAWFTTGAGAFVHAVNLLMVQSDERETRLVPAIPAAWSAFGFHDLLSTGRVTVSAEVRGGRLEHLVLRSPRKQTRRYVIPARFLPEGWRPAAAVSVVQKEGAVEVEIDLEPGETQLI